MKLIDYMAETGWWLDEDYQDETGELQAQSPNGLVQVTQLDCGWKVVQYTDEDHGTVKAEAEFTHCPDWAVIAFLNSLERGDRG